MVPGEVSDSRSIEFSMTSGEQAVRSEDMYASL